jgi:hypothetical protein
LATSGLYGRQGDRVLGGWQLREVGAICEARGEVAAALVMKDAGGWAKVEEPMLSSAATVLFVVLGRWSLHGAAQLPFSWRCGIAG